MRIIAGQWRGRKLVAPQGADPTARPRTGRVKPCSRCSPAELARFQDLRVADLYAGSGALGLEALSRGAGHCTSLSRMIAQRSRRSAPTSTALGLAERSQLLARSALALPAGRAVRPGLRRPSLRGRHRDRLRRPRQLAPARVGAAAGSAIETARGDRVDAAVAGGRRRSATSAAPGLLCFGGFSLRRLLDLVELGGDPAGPSPPAAAVTAPFKRALGPRAFAAAAAVAMLGQRRERRGRPDRQQVGDQRAFQQLQQGVGGVAGIAVVRLRLPDPALPPLPLLGDTAFDRRFLLCALLVAALAMISVSCCARQ